MDYSILLIIPVLFGLLYILIDSVAQIREGRYSLDYVAFLAMVLALYSGEYLAGAVVAVMFTGGRFLERFATSRAEASLKRLSDTIPKTCLIEKDGTLTEEPIQSVTEGQVILVKKNEIVPLDGTLIATETALLNLANLTGEVAPVEVKEGTFIKSGSINTGETLRLRIVGDFSSSTYQKLVGLVENAKANPSRTVQLSERANFYFTLLVLVIAGAAYAFTGDLVRLLAVLVIATPCPLIIAAPVAFVGGMSRAARANIILRKPAAIEGIDRASTIFFDKTGTLTLGEPILSSTGISDEVLGIVAGLEIHSLHPIARTIVNEARRRNVSFVISEDVKEEIGKGISGTINGKRYLFSGVSLLEDGVEIATFHFDDVLKEGAHDLISGLNKKGVHTAIITGDTKENAEKVFGASGITIYARQSPEDKYRLVAEEKAKGRTVVMVGDGLNDAPALAKADVGIVFSGTENGASIDAADVAILGGGLEKLNELFSVSRHTVRVARQSIYGGIGLSLVGMIFAALGYISPVQGALIQESIDVIVILNALRTLVRF